MRNRILASNSIVLLTLLALLTGSATAWGSAVYHDGALEFSHPISDDPYFTERDIYFSRMLRLALEKSGEPFRIEPVLTPPMQETRSTLFLTTHRYNVHWLMTNTHREQTLIPIRIPLYKGLIGWRLLFIHPDMRTYFEQINSIEQLQRLSVTQGVDWPDSGILKSNGFNLRPSINWNSMSEVVRLKRVDYFPRAVTEIWKEQALATRKSLIVEPHLALHYPAAYYFFVSPGMEQHARAIENGLMTAIVDGSFDALFNEFFADDIALSQLDQRRILRLSNPMLPPRTPLQNRYLWYQNDNSNN